MYVLFSWVMQGWYKNQPNLATIWKIRFFRRLFDSKKYKKLLWASKGPDHTSNVWHGKEKNFSRGNCQLHKAQSALRGEIFISTVRPTVHTNQTENGAVWKRSSHRRNLKTLALRFSVDGKHFDNRAFRKRWHHDDHVISLTKFSSNTNPKWPLHDCCLFRFFPISSDFFRVWTGL